MGYKKFTKFTKLGVTFEKKFFLNYKLSLLYQQNFMKANTKLCSTQYSAL